MSRTPSYIHRRREYLGKKPRAFGGLVDSYSAWTTVYVAPTLERAQESVEEHSRNGLWVHAIFHKGKRLL